MTFRLKSPECKYFSRPVTVLDTHWWFHNKVARPS